jgi:Flp pilus assembly protein TadB
MRPAGKQRVQQGTFPYYIRFSSFIPMTRINGNWLERIIALIVAAALVVLGVFFLAAALIAGSIIAALILVRWWWLTRRLRRQGRNKDVVDGEYTIIERSEDPRIPRHDQ